MGEKRQSMTAHEVAKTVPDYPPLRPENRNFRAPLKRLTSVVIKYLIAFSLFGYYSLAGALAELGPSSQGYRNAENIWQIQRHLSLPNEVWLQHIALPHSWIFGLLNRYYAYAHFPVTLLFVVWVSVVRKEHWSRVASALSVVTFLCLSIEAFVPVAPPRLYTPIGAADTLARFGPSVYDNATVGKIADQYGAFPSLHFGWSVIVAWGIISLCPSLGLFRWVALLHPAITLVAVILTGNHYWLDCIVAGLLAPIAFSLTDGWMKRSSLRLRARLRKPLVVASIPLCLFGLVCISQIFI